MSSYSNADSPAAKSFDRNHYLISWVISLIVIVGLVGGVNLIVDPEARFLIIDKEGFNLVKTSLATNSRKGKANALRQCDYDTLVLGASSAETGITRQHKVLREAKYYNASLRGGSMYEMRRMAEYALQHQDLKAVVLGLDFSTFSSRIVFLEDFADSPLAEDTSIASLARYLFSLRTFRYSLETVRLNVRGDAKGRFCNDSGENKRTYEIEEASKAFGFILRSYARDQFSNYIAGDLHFTNLAALLEELRAANVAVYAFISPTHVLQNELIREMGLRDEYEDWKRKLARIFAEGDTTGPKQPQAVLWDFSGYNAVNTEVIPDVDSGVYLQQYSDPVHFEQEVGNQILDRMFELLPEMAASQTDFGIMLTPENVEAVLKQERLDSERFHREHPEQIARLRHLLRSDSGSTGPVAF